MACACKPGLKGGGARARKKQRRMPSTPKEIRDAFAAAGRAQSPQRASDPEFWGEPRSKQYAPIVPGSVAKGHKGRCVFFVVEHRGRLPGRDPHPGENKYEVTKLCSGGRVWTGLRMHSSLATAKEAARRLAVVDSTRR